MTFQLGDERFVAGEGKRGRGSFSQKTPVPFFGPNTNSFLIRLPQALRVELTSSSRAYPRIAYHNLAGRLKSALDPLLSLHVIRNVGNPAQLGAPDTGVCPEVVAEIRVTGCDQCTEQHEGERHKEQHESHGFDRM